MNCLRRESFWPPSPPAIWTPQFSVSTRYVPAGQRMWGRWNHTTLLRFFADSTPPMAACCGLYTPESTGAFLPSGNMDCEHAAILSSWSFRRSCRIPRTSPCLSKCCRMNCCLRAEWNRLCRIDRRMESSSEWWTRMRQWISLECFSGNRLSRLVSVPRRVHHWGHSECLLMRSGQDSHRWFRLLARHRVVRIWFRPVCQKREKKARKASFARHTLRIPFDLFYLLRLAERHRGWSKRDS